MYIVLSEFLQALQGSQNKSILNYYTASASPPGEPSKSSSACRRGARQGHARGHACAWVPKLLNVAFWWAIGFCPGDHCSTKDNSSISQSNVPSGHQPLQSRTRRDTVRHRLTRPQPPIQHAQYRAPAAGACSESVASPLASIESAGRGAAAVGTKIKGEYDLERLRRVCQGLTDQPSTTYSSSFIVEEPSNSWLRSEHSALSLWRTSTIGLSRSVHQFPRSILSTTTFDVEHARQPGLLQRHPCPRQA